MSKAPLFLTRTLKEKTVGRTDCIDDDTVELSLGQTLPIAPLHFGDKASRLRMENSCDTMNREMLKSSLRSMLGL